MTIAEDQDSRSLAELLVAPSAISYINRLMFNRQNGRALALSSLPWSQSLETIWLLHRAWQYYTYPQARQIVTKVLVPNCDRKEIHKAWVDLNPKTPGLVLSQLWRVKQSRAWATIALNPRKWVREWSRSHTQRDIPIFTILTERGSLSFYSRILWVSTGKNRLFWQKSTCYQKIDTLFGILS